ncbi:hypothetical protein [uncultured Apibacter sp.]|uniref:tetratricopeptide repeat protein n=1 Tax=uncultured Apibacter sp. TaxID=1778616 RepID=UPI0025DD91E5|nr:hypothetical protein [uncultured Apibacter sp.]
MKKIIQIFLGIIAILGIIVIAKNNYIFSNPNQERLDKGWIAYQNNDYNYAIKQFILLNYSEYPEIILPLSDSYIQIGEYDNAIRNLKNAYNEKIYKNQNELSKLVNLLGIAYSKNNDLKQARFYFLEAKKLGNQNSLRNIQILDSLEQVQKNAPDINQ